ncbi:hypothetical protein ACHAQH_000705 [Verticillium albo-atrum]
MIAHAALGKLYDIPVIITTSAETGPNGPLPQKILDIEAVRVTGRSQMIVAGIVTDVCVTFLSLSMREEGYSVWANVEVTGTTSALIRDVSKSRMQAAGVQLVGIFSTVAHLYKDWRNPPGAAKMVEWFNQYAPAYMVVSQLFNAAQQIVTV